ncbi:MAG: OmpA family protein [Halothece sp.]
MSEFEDFLSYGGDLEEEEGDASVLLSIGDMMSGLLLIFALLFITVLVQLKEREEPIRVVIGTVLEELQGNNIDVDVNKETGDISLSESILFDENSAELKPEGKAFLQRFIPVYSGVIFSRPLFEQEITRVVIEGHTSSKGDYETNLNLSARRSLSVAEYIFSDEINFPTENKLKNKIATSARGEIEARQDIDDPKDRKVTFRFQFRGQEVLRTLGKNTSLEE